MDIVPNEPSAELNKESILVPGDAAKALGRGLRQSMFSALQEINVSLDRLRGIPNHQRMENAFKRISGLVYLLENAKVVKIVVLSRVGNDFEFSEESEETEEEKPKQGKLLMNKNITPKFVSALSHNIRNPLSIVLGFAKNAGSEEAKKIVEACSQIENVIIPLNNAQEIKMTTDTEGNTVVTPIRDSS